MSKSLNMYKNSEFKSTREEMSKLTEAELDFVDSVYDWAELNYDRGGDTICECYEPWTIVKEFKTIHDAKRMAALHLERREEIEATRW